MRDVSSQTGGHLAFPSDKQGGSTDEEARMASTDEEAQTAPHPDTKERERSRAVERATRVAGR